MRTFTVCILILPVVILPGLARAQWLPDGIVLSSALQAQLEPAIVSDGAGGAIVTWFDHRSGAADIYARRVKAAGTVQWIADGNPLCTAVDAQVDPMIISDGAGGAIVTWRDARGSETDIYAQRVNAGGAALWALNGVALCAATGYQDSPSIVSDGADGAIVTWSDARSGTNYDIYAQRVNAVGVVQWLADGVALCTDDSMQSYPTIASDGAGGAIATWNDSRSGHYFRDIYAQRVDASGSVQWAIDGVAVCTAAEIQTYSTIVSDGSGGAIVTWGDSRSETSSYDIYAQRLDSSGAVQWMSDGVPLCTAANTQFDPQMVPDGSGGAVVVWTDTRNDHDNYDLYAQRVTASGAVQWTANGVAISTAAEDQNGSAIISDGAGGAFVTWNDFRTGGYDIYAQRVGGSGFVLWATDGAAVSDAANSQVFPSIASDGAGGAIVTWRDFRSGNWDIYAQRLAPNGLIPTEVGGVTPVTFMLVGNNHPNPFSAETAIDVTLSRDSPMSIEVFDVAGRRVRTLDVGQVRAGSVRLVFDGLDQDANTLPSGVYFFRLQAGAESVTKKLVIAR